MIDPAYLETLRLILSRLDDPALRWAITGSLSLALQGLPVPAGEFVLQSDREGVYEIEHRLAEFDRQQPVGSIQTGQRRAHAGRLLIHGMPVDLLGEVQEPGPDGKWQAVDLPRLIHFVSVDSLRVPVLSAPFQFSDRSSEQLAAIQPEITAITNYHLISPSLATAGMPQTEQLALVAAEGYQAIINLALPDADNAIPDEGRLAASHQMDYLNIPVIWEQPTRTDLERFFQEMDQRREQHVFVHCVMNMRVSCFVFLYRVLRLGVPPETARQDMLAIWSPNPTWQAFIDQALAQQW